MGGPCSRPHREGAQAQSLLLAAAALPQSYQAAQLIAQQWRQLGLEVEVKPSAAPAQTQLIWFSRDKWDVTMWRMVGRPERSDPDEFLYSLYHSSYIEKGYNLVGYLNPEYDKLAEKQRTQLDREERRKTAFAMQEIINRDQPNGLPGPSQVPARLQQGGVQGGQRRQPERHRHPQHLDLPQHRAARRAEGPDHQQQRNDQRHQPALYRQARSTAGSPT